MRRILVVVVALAACAPQGAIRPQGRSEAPSCAATQGDGGPHAHGPRPSDSRQQVDDFKITMLSDSIVSRTTLAEWGFSALVEITSAGQTKRVLFDTGGSPGNVLHNSTALAAPLKDEALTLDQFCHVSDVILSHNHRDHTSGLNSLRAACLAPAGAGRAAAAGALVRNVDSFKNAYVGGSEIFAPRIDGEGHDVNVMAGERSKFVAQGGHFVVNDQPTSDFLGLPGVWLTGKIERTHDEKTYPGTPPVTLAGRQEVDTVPEEHALVINTKYGIVVLTGCAHAGIINTIEQAKKLVGGNPSVAVVGGIHLFSMPLGNDATQGTVRWVGAQMAALGVNQVLGAHCTGLERLALIRDEYLGLDRAHATFSTVGTVFSLTKGIEPPPMALNSPVE